MTLITHPHEPASDAHRAGVAGSEPRSLRTFTPTQAVLRARAFTKRSPDRNIWARPRS